MYKELFAYEQAAGEIETYEASYHPIFYPTSGDEAGWHEASETPVLCATAHAGKELDGKELDGKELDGKELDGITKYSSF